MTPVQMWRTSDGVLHDSKTRAMRHADQRYGNALLALAQEICRLDSKYSAVSEWLEANLDRCTLVAALKADLACTESEKDEP